MERYRIPKGVDTSSLGISSGDRRLFPIFRDREELASAADLSGSIRSALSSSRALIVICSPAAARSRWVNEEIRCFRETGGGSDIFCLLVGGVPDPSDPDNAFPEAILESEDGRTYEPLAADVRPNGDGKRVALLKIAAGMLGLGIDELRQRDAQRRLRLRTLVSAGSVLTAAITLGLAIAAQIARDESEIRRVQAERLITFMLGELRTQLEPVGRLDLLDSVGDEAMSYFEILEGQGTEQEQLARAMALRQIGEVRFRQGRLRDAQDTFEASRAIADALYRSNPADENYLFELGQAEFWVGYAAMEQSDLEQTARSMQRYMEYTRMLVAAHPERSDYRRELVYAYSNLGTMALREQRADEALDYFQESNGLTKSLLSSDPENLGLKHDLANGYSWLGATQLQRARLRESELAYRSAVEILSDVYQATGNPLYAEHLSENQSHLANVLLHRGKVGAARQFYEKSDSLLEELVSRDPENAIWRTDEAITHALLGDLKRVAGESDASIEQLDGAVEALRSMTRDGQDRRIVNQLALAERSLAILSADSGDLDAALALVSVAQGRLSQLADGGDVDISLSLAMVEESRGHFLRRQGEEDAARSIWRRALTRVPDSTHQPIHLAVKQILQGHLHQYEDAERLKDTLAAAEFADPRYPLF